MVGQLIPKARLAISGLNGWDRIYLETVQTFLKALGEPTIYAINTVGMGQRSRWSPLSIRRRGLELEDLEVR
jgi:hypothetical protein